MTLDPGPFAETLRRAHCAHGQAANPEHVCVGTCTIDRGGVRLECVACGSDSQPLAPSASEARGARAVVEAIGMDWSSLTPEAQRAAVNALGRLKP
jgi:hypothetical protein